MERPSAQLASLDRMVRAVERVKERLLRAAGCLEKAGIPYAVVGGNAVATWVSTVDEAAVRNTQDVDILVRRADTKRIRAAMESAGFIFRHVAGLDLYLERAGDAARHAVHLVYAGELVRPGEPAVNPDATDSERAASGAFQVLTLEALVQIKLTAWRDKDRTHLRDLMDVGLLDASWLGKLSPPLAARLQHLLDTPGG